MIGFLLHVLGLRCQHPVLLRERRPLHGLPVPHYVCQDCGYAAPIVSRTAAEQQQAVTVGRPAPLTAHREQAAIVVVRRIIR